MSFIYTLRYMLDPRTNTPKKDRQLLEFVQKAKIDDVAFFINGEELNHSHLTAQQTQVWLDAIVPLQKELTRLGITTSLNPWTTIMHSDRGFKIDPEIGFAPFVDINGVQAQDMACPADPKWRKYLCARYAQYARLHPRRLWLEDDFRHYNHTPLKLMCFCDRHMKIYQEKLGEEESRAVFVENMLKPGKPAPERKIYLDQARQEMIENEHLIEHAVHQISPETDLAQMTSFPDWHAIEGRDWTSLFDAQAGSGHPRVCRPHLPAYNEVSPIQYGRAFEAYSRITATYLGSQAELYPELENAMWTPQVKSNRFIAFQLVTTALLGAKGIMLNLFDMMGNGIDMHWQYDRLLSDLKPFLNELLKHPLHMDRLRGIKILVDQDSSYYLQTKKGKNPEELLPHEKNWASLLSSYGFATTILPVTPDRQIEGQIIAVSGQLLRDLNNDQVTQLIQKNTILLDGESLQVLYDRHLDQNLHIEKATWLPCKSGYQSFEQADGITVQGVKDPRVTMLQHTGDYLKLSYKPDRNVKIWTSAYSSTDEKLCNMMAVIDDHILVLPIDQDPKYGWESQFSTYKQGIVQQMVSSMTAIDYLDPSLANVKLNVQEDGKLVWISNFSLDTYDQIKWHLGADLISNQATLIRQEGDHVHFKPIKLVPENNIVTIHEKLHPLETIQVRFD